jgi:hypothetical protein
MIATIGTKKRLDQKSWSLLDKASIQPQQTSDHQTNIVQPVMSTGGELPGNRMQNFEGPFMSATPSELSRLYSAGLGIGDAVDIDSLEKRLRAAPSRTHSQVSAPRQVCAWVRVPS